MESLPLEIHAHICDYLSASDRARICATSRAWYDAVEIARTNMRRRLDDLTREKLREICDRYRIEERRFFEQPSKELRLAFCDLMMQRGIIESDEINGDCVLEISEDRSVEIPDPMHLFTTDSSFYDCTELRIYDPVSGSSVYLDTILGDYIASDIITVASCDKIDGVWPIFKVARLELILCLCQGILFTLGF